MEKFKIFSYFMRNRRRERRRSEHKKGGEKSFRAAGPSQTEPEHQPIREVVVKTDYTRGLGRRIPNRNFGDAVIINFKYVYNSGQESSCPFSVSLYETTTTSIRCHSDMIRRGHDCSNSCGQERPTTNESGNRN